MKEELEALIKLWKSTAKGYKIQIEESRSKGILCECSIGTLSAYNSCIHDLEFLLRKIK